MSHSPNMSSGLVAAVRQCSVQWDLAGEESESRTLRASDCLNGGRLQATEALDPIKYPKDNDVRETFDISESRSNLGKFS